MNQEEIHLDLEKKLMDDAEGVVKGELEAYLGSYQASLRRLMDQGLPPEEFSRIQCIQLAIAKALEVLGRAWALWRS